VSIANVQGRVGPRGGVVRGIRTGEIGRERAGAARIAKALIVYQPQGDERDTQWVERPGAARIGKAPIVFQSWGGVEVIHNGGNGSGGVRCGFRKLWPLFSRNSGPLGWWGKHTGSGGSFQGFCESPGLARVLRCRVRYEGPRSSMRRPRSRMRSVMAAARSGSWRTRPQSSRGLLVVKSMGLR